MPDQPVTSPDDDLRIDDLAHRCGLTVDTIRYYQRERLLPPATRVGRSKRYGPEHLERLDRIRELQARRFSLAAIKALLDGERPGIVEGIFPTGGADYTYDELVSRSHVDPQLAARLHDVGLLREPAEFGRDAYDGADLDVLLAVSELSRLGLPDDLVVGLARIYTEGVEHMQSQVLAMFRGSSGATWGDDRELAEVQDTAAASAGALLPLVTRLVQYVHQRTLQRLTLGAIADEARRRDDA